MKILCIIDSLGSGGAQRQLVNLAIGFKKHGHEVSFLCYHKEEFYKNYLDENGISLSYVIESNYILRLFKMRTFIRKGGYDSVLSFLDSANFISIFSGFPFRTWKIVVGERNANPLILKSFKLIFYRYFFFFADYIVSNSNANIDLVKKVNPFLVQRKFRVIYNIVDLDFWKPENVEELDEKEKDEFNLVIAARHQKQKNLKGLIEGVYLLSEKEKSRLKINWYGDEHAGDNTLKEGLILIDKYELNSIFNFYPATNKIKQIIMKADAIGLFSFFEGLSNSICEGLACGKFIISSNVSDVSVFVNEENGVLCDPNSFSSIAEALRKALKLEHKQIAIMEKVSRNRAELFFGAENILTEYLNLLIK